MKLSIIGTGYVGLVTGTCFAELGNNVTCVDIDEAKIKTLKKGQIPIYEPGLKELVQRNITEDRLHFTSDTAMAIENSTVVFSAVGTPPDENHEADLRFVKAVAKTFGQTISEYKIFVNKSTVPVGTNHLCKEIIQEELDRRGVKVDFDVVSNPEFLREGVAVRDTLNPDRIVVGVANERPKEILEKLYNPIVRTGRPIFFTDILSAEIIKYAANSFLATKISFINEIAGFCDKVGGNVKEVSRGIGMDNRIGGRFLHAGIGYGGSCFPKDVQALIQTGKSFDFDFEILRSVEAVNTRQKNWANEIISDLWNDFSDKTIAVWGASFKPKTDDIREASSLKFIEQMLEKGAGKIKLYDPVALKNVRAVFGDKIEYVTNPLEAVEEADAIFLMTEWDMFRGQRLEQIKAMMRGNVFVDGRNVFDKQEMVRLGFRYFSVGR